MPLTTINRLKQLETGKPGCSPSSTPTGCSASQCTRCPRTRGGTASGATTLTVGYFSQYLILDRVGVSAEIVPHLFGMAFQQPTGQRDFYALWRNSATVLAWQAFRSEKNARGNAGCGGTDRGDSATASKQPAPKSRPAPRSPSRPSSGG